MKLRSMKDAKKALATLKNQSNGRLHYPVLFKKALMEFLKKENLSIEQACKTLDMNKSTLYTWQNQYNDGLYNMTGAYAVSQKSASLNGAILKKLKQEIADVQRKLALVEECESLGLKIVA